MSLVEFLHLLLAILQSYTDVW